ADTMAELTINYRNSPIVSEDWGGFTPGFHRAGPAAGDRAPDGQLREPSAGESKRLFELLLDTRHSLLFFCGRGAKMDEYRNLEAIGKSVREKYGHLVSAHLIIAGEDVPEGLTWDGSLLLDVKEAVHNRYGADISCLYLVRPDGYVGFRSLPAHSQNI